MKCSEHKKWLEKVLSAMQVSAYALSTAPFNLKDLSAFEREALRRRARNAIRKEGQEENVLTADIFAGITNIEDEREFLIDHFGLVVEESMQDAPALPVRFMSEWQQQFAENQLKAALESGDLDNLNPPDALRNTLLETYGLQDNALARNLFDVALDEGETAGSNKVADIYKGFVPFIRWFSGQYNDEVMDTSGDPFLTQVLSGKQTPFDALHNPPPADQEKTISYGKVVKGKKKGTVQFIPFDEPTPAEPSPLKSKLDKTISASANELLDDALSAHAPEFLNTAIKKAKASLNEIDDKKNVAGVDLDAAIQYANSVNVTAGSPVSLDTDAAVQDAKSVDQKPAGKAKKSSKKASAAAPAKPTLETLKATPAAFESGANFANFLNENGELWNSYGLESGWSEDMNGSDDGIAIILEKPADIQQVKGILQYIMGGPMQMYGEWDSDICLIADKSDDGEQARVFVWSCDFTKSQRDDIGSALFGDKGLTFIEDGTPIRTTNKAGPGTKGTRKYEGVGPFKVAFH